MNERIRELREQAGLQPYYDAQEWQIKKFAELVLQDVMNLFGDERISLHYLEQPCCEDSVYLLQLKIKEHFGVRE
jgi:hypothetical protein